MGHAVRDCLCLPAAIRERILAHTTARPGEEVCGLLGGRGNRARHYYPVTNVAQDPARAYLMDPGEQIGAMRRMREQGEILLAIFHSHPESAARPSGTDLSMAEYPDTIYLIAGPTDRAMELTAWYYDGLGFTPLAIHPMDP